MIKIIGGIMFLAGYVLFCISITAIAFEIYFWFGVVVASIAMLVTGAAFFKDKKQDAEI